MFEKLPLVDGAPLSYRKGFMYMLFFSLFFTFLAFLFFALLLWLIRRILYRKELSEIHREQARSVFINPENP